MTVSSLGPAIFAPAGQLDEKRTAKVLDLSDDGLFLSTMTLWPPETRLVLLLTIAGERVPVRLAGEVVWARTAEPSGMYVKFTEPADHPTRERLRIAAPRSKLDKTEKPRA